MKNPGRARRLGILLVATACVSILGCSNIRQGLRRDGADLSRLGTTLRTCWENENSMSFRDLQEGLRSDARETTFMDGLREGIPQDILDMGH